MHCVLILHLKDMHQSELLEVQKRYSVQDMQSKANEMIALISSVFWLL